MQTTVQIQKWGNSQGIRLPKSLLQSAFFKDDETVKVTATKNQIIITKDKPHKTLQERFEDYPTDCQCAEYDWGECAGDEVW